MQRRAFVLGALALALAVQPAAADDEAKRLLEGIYKTYVGSTATGLDYHTEAKARRTFTPDTVRLFVRDWREAKGEVGRLEFDPFVNGQDFEVSAYAVSVEGTGPDQARAQVQITNMGKREVVIHDLQRTANGWRIHDIRWPGTKGSLRTILSRPTI
jgi:hypothetical protein